MDYGPENLWKKGQEYFPQIDSSEFTYEMQNELEQVASWLKTQQKEKIFNKKRTGVFASPFNV